MADRLAHSETNRRRIATVEQCFGGSGQPLAVPNRVLVGEGVLTKMCRKKPKRRQFFLFNDILVYGNILIDKKKYNRQHIIPLENVKLSGVPDEGNLHNGWQIISPAKSFTVYAATSTEKQEWMAHINRCVQEQLTKHGKKPSVFEDSPVWVPDADARLCMHCKKSEFTVINRKHHCRKCGIVCCNSCSNKRWMLRQQSSKPLRVCQSCYDVLSAAESGRDQRVPSMAQPNNENSSGEESSDDEEDVTSEESHQPQFYEK